MKDMEIIGICKPSATKHKKKTEPLGFGMLMSPLSESNQRPTDYKSVALPAELRRLYLLGSLLNEVQK